MLVFHRASFTQLWITLQANEPLALIGSNFVEDYFGNSGQLTLRNMDDDTRTSFIVNEDTSVTPSIPHDVFTGFIDLSTLPDGIYHLEGRVRDVAGNYRILSEVQTPFGNEDVTLFEIELTPLAIVVRVPKEADVILIQKPYSDLFFVEKPEADLELLDKALSIDIILKMKAEIDVLIKEKPFASVSSIPKPDLDIINVYTTV